MQGVLHFDGIIWRTLPLFDHAIFVTCTLCFTMLLITISGVLRTVVWTKTLALAIFALLIFYLGLT